MTPTPRPEEGVVSWNINTACNYRCSYCTQRFKEDRGRWSRDTPRFLAAFARLTGRWEIKLSGGEPFVHPTLLEIVGGLAGLGHRVSVVTPAIAERFAARGLVFKVQPEKQDREVIDYAPDERGVLLGLGGHNLTGRIVHEYRGRPCWAGSRYFILDDQGTAFRCYPARRLRIERMGDFLSPEFTLAGGPSPCLYRQCNCTVPIARRMMPRDAIPVAEELE
jgi:hypothetical protein